MRTLIFGTSYIGDANAYWIARQWLHLNELLNPGTDVLVVDSASPIPFPTGNRWLIQLGYNIGHPSRGGSDGWGRAFCVGLEYAIACEYDLAVHIETDLLCAVPVHEIIASSREALITAQATPYLFIETGLMAINTAWADGINLVDKYDWASNTHGDKPEERIKRICNQGGIDTSRLRGRRDEWQDGSVKDHDYLTHATIPTFLRFLEFRKIDSA
jgi:hypothetical protein